MRRQRTPTRRSGRRRRACSPPPTAVAPPRVDGPWPDERYELASPAVALACLELLTDEARWIHRRVETIDLLAQELVRRQVSVDFTLPAPLLDDLRIGPGGPWCVPLAILEKRPLRNFDL